MRAPMTPGAGHVRLQAMTNSPRATTVNLLGGLRHRGSIGRRLGLFTLLGGLDLELTEVPPEGAAILKVSLIGGVSLVVPADVRVEVGGFTLLGGKDVERRPDLPATAPVVRVRAFGVIGGVRVRVQQPAH
jgi:hypothetical protein